MVLFPSEIVRGAGIAQFFDFNFAATLLSFILLDMWLEAGQSSAGDAIPSLLTLSNSDGSAR